MQPTFKPPLPAIDEKVSRRKQEIGNKASQQKKDDNQRAHSQAVFPLSSIGCFQGSFGDI
jgi:hypothetical protein